MIAFATVIPTAVACSCYPPSNICSLGQQLEQSVEVLQLEKLRAEQDAAQAHRYIEVSLEAAMHLLLTFSSMSGA